MFFPFCMAKPKQHHTPAAAVSAPPKNPTDPLEQRRQESRREDSESIRRALGGDQKAFRKLRAKYYEAIYNLIYRMIHNRDEVEDLTQEAFVKAFASLETFNEEFAFSTWMYKIATNNSIDHIRKKRLLTFSIDKPIASDESDYQFELPDSTFEPDQELIAGQRTKFLQEAIASLPPKYRQVIMMRHVDEMEYGEISKKLRLPLGTVKAHIFRAREMLYRALKNRMRHY
jgi:RNA polymerase sigma-70 factor (ECF subfamily)